MNAREYNLEVARTIVQQLGNEALTLLGANNVLANGPGLQFNIRGCRKINRIQIVLDPSDTYTLTFAKISQRGLDYKVVATVADVYCDQLHDIIEAQTGLYTTLFSRG